MISARARPSDSLRIGTDPWFAISADFRDPGPCAACMVTTLPWHVDRRMAGNEVGYQARQEVRVMAQSIRDVMTEDVVVVPTSATVAEAGREMRERDIGNVVVLQDGTVAGILTDRDIVIRAVADERSPA